MGNRSSSTTTQQSTTTTLSTALANTTTTNTLIPVNNNNVHPPPKLQNLIQRWLSFPITTPATPDSISILQQLATLIQKKPNGNTLGPYVLSSKEFTKKVVSILNTITLIPTAESVLIESFISFLSIEVLNRPLIYHNVELMSGLKTRIKYKSEISLITFINLSWDEDIAHEMTCNNKTEYIQLALINLTTWPTFVLNILINISNYPNSVQSLDIPVVLDVMFALQQNGTDEMKIKSTMVLANVIAGDEERLDMIRLSPTNISLFITLLKHVSGKKSKRDYLDTEWELFEVLRAIRYLCVEESNAALFVVQGISPLLYKSIIKAASKNDIKAILYGIESMYEFITENLIDKKMITRSSAHNRKLLRAIKSVTLKSNEDVQWYSAKRAATMLLAVLEGKPVMDDGQGRRWMKGLPVKNGKKKGVEA
jgi:hypothetical protein